MAIPEFNEQGDLPVGVHQATLDETLAHFGHGTPQRQLVTLRLKRIYNLAHRTGKVARFIVYGSYVTAKPAPHDVDIFLVMRDDFREDDYTEEILPVFDHLRSHNELAQAFSGFAREPSYLKRWTNSLRIGKPNAIKPSAELSKLSRR